MRGEAEPRLAEGGREGRGIQGKWAQTQGLGAGLGQARDRGHRDRLWGDPDKDRDWPWGTGTGTSRDTAPSKGNWAQDQDNQSDIPEQGEPGQEG